MIRGRFPGDIFEYLLYELTLIICFAIGIECFARRGSKVSLPVHISSRAVYCGDGSYPDSLASVTLTFFHYQFRLPNPDHLFCKTADITLRQLVQSASVGVFFDFRIEKSGNLCYYVLNKLSEIRYKRDEDFHK